MGGWQRTFLRLQLEKIFFLYSGQLCLQDAWTGVVKHDMVLSTCSVTQNMLGGSTCEFSFLSYVKQFGSHYIRGWQVKTDKFESDYTGVVLKLPPNSTL